MAFSLLDQLNDFVPHGAHGLHVHLYVISCDHTCACHRFSVADAAVNRVLVSAHLSNRNDVQSTDIGATLQTPTRAFSSFGQSSRPRT